MTEEKKVFFRAASGLIRKVSTFDAALFSILATNLGVGMMYSFIWAPFLFPGGNMILALLFMLVLLSPHVLCFIMLSAAMPRSGGDYIFNSRILHPLIGFVGNFMVVILVGYWVATNSYFFVDWVIQPALGTMGMIVGGQTGQWLLGASEFLYGNLPMQLLIAAIAVTIVFLVFLGPISRVMKVQRVGWVIAIASTIVIFGLFAMTNHSGFVNTLDSFMYTNLGVSNGYQSVIDEAISYGFNPNVAFNISDSFLMFAIMAYTTFSTVMTVSIGGELKSGAKIKSQAAIQFSGILFTTVMAIILASLLTTVVGQPFLAATGYQYFALWAYPTGFAPAYTFFAMILTNNILLLWLITIGTMVWLVVYAIPWWAAATRSVFAWAFDRIIPSKLADVSPTSGAPINSNIMMYLITLAFIGLLYFFPILTGAFVWGSIAAIYLFMAVPVAIAAMVFPLRKTLYEASPLVRYKVGPIPVISIVGMLAVIFDLIIIAVYMVPEYAIGGSDPGTLTMIGIITTVGIIIYFVSRYLRKREGVDIDLSFKSIPPA